MKRLASVVAVLGLFASAMALSTFKKTFNEHYGVKEGSNLAKAECGICHVRAKGGKLNPYGKDLQAAMKEAKAKKLTVEILAKVEKLDSDKDGKSNIEEIKADSLPGGE